MGLYGKQADSLFLRGLCIKLLSVLHRRCVPLFLHIHLVVTLNTTDASELHYEKSRIHVFESFPNKSFMKCERNMAIFAAVAPKWWSHVELWRRFRDGSHHILCPKLNLMRQSAAFANLWISMRRRQDLGKKLLHTGQLSLITMFHRPIRLSYLRQQGDYLVVGQQTHVHHSGHIADGRKSHTPGPTRSRYWMKTLQNQKAETCRLTIEYCGPQKHETVF